MSVHLNKIHFEEKLAFFFVKMPMIKKHARYFIIIHPYDNQ